MQMGLDAGNTELKTEDFFHSQILRKFCIVFLDYNALVPAGWLKWVLNSLYFGQPGQTKTVNIENIFGGVELGMMLE